MSKTQKVFLKLALVIVYFHKLIFAEYSRYII